MNNLNLDISKYTSGELYEIFSIKENYKNNADLLMNHLNQYKNSTLSNNLLTLKEKDNINFFIDKVLNKLLNDKNIPNKDLTYSSSSNIIVNDAPANHPIIANQNEIAGENAKTYEGDTSEIYAFKPGFINPINIKSINKTVNIDSRFRDNYFNTKSSDFIVDIPDTLKKVVKMRLTEIEFPSTIYSINENHNNNYFHIQIDSSYVKINLASGNYDLSNLTTNINTQLQSHDISFNIQNNTGKSVFTNNNNASQCNIIFNFDENNNEYSNDPLIMKLGWLLGFRFGSYNINSNNPLYSEGICLINNPEYLFLCVNDFTNAANNNFIAAFNSSILSPHILARINYQSLLTNNINNDYINSNKLDLGDNHRIRSYFGPVDINKLHIQLLDNYGRIVDLNNMDMSLTITFELLYD